MGLQRRAVDKALWAPRARKTFPVPVNLHVLLQVCLLRKPFSTARALEWLQTRVGEHVALQVSTRGEALATILFGASVWPVLVGQMCLHVLLQIAALNEALSTLHDLANKRPLPGVRSQVDSQAVPVGKRLVTFLFRAMEGFLTGVYPPVSFQIPHHYESLVTV